MNALTLSELRKRLDSAEVVAATIDIPLDRWPKNCFGIATALVEKGLVPGGVAVYGHWTGDIDPKSCFASRRALGFCNHGWVALPNGAGVVDPTRWVFEDERPYIYIGQRDPHGFICEDYEAREDEFTCLHCGCAEEEHAPGFFRPCRTCAAWPYDEGGNLLLKRLHAARPLPKPRSGALRFPVRCPAAPKTAVVAWLALALSDERVIKHGLTHEQCRWVANAPLDVLGDFAADVYAWLTAHGLNALIPLDNRLAVERKGETHVHHP